MERCYTAVMSIIKKAETRPIPESYWVELGRLLAGEYPGGFDGELTRKRIDALLEAGFDTFIDLTGPDEIAAYTQALFEEAKVYELDVKHYRFPIKDFGLPTYDQMKSILDKVDKSLQAGHKVYLHCWGGIGRTGTTIGCYLVRRGKTGEEALRQLAAWWKNVPKSRYHPHSPETQAQADFIRHWGEHEANL